jgi:hypothetical protein
MILRLGSEWISLERLLGCEFEANGLESRTEAYDKRTQAACGFEAYRLLLVELYKPLQAIDEEPIC